MLLTEALNLYLNEKKAMNLSQSTIATYKCTCEGFIIHMPTNGTVCDCCTKESYEEYLRFLQKAGKNNDISVASKARSIKAWFYWLAERGLIPHVKLVIPKYQERIPDTYNDEELSLLLKIPQEKCSEVTYISWVMINILIATGARLGSLRNIKVRDFTYNQSRLVLNTTKNNLPIELPINGELSAIIMKYIVRFDLKPDDYLFSTAAGTQYASRTVEDYIGEYIRSKGISKKRMVHAFRHTFAKNYYTKTHDIYKLKEILGHSTLSMTEKYVRSLGCALSETIEYNPQREHASMPSSNRKKRRRQLSLDISVDEFSS